MRVNHHLLCALGVGHPHLETVRAVCATFGFPCKLTGAGGGGCAIALTSRCACAQCRPLSAARKGAEEEDGEDEDEQRAVERLCEALRERGVETFRSSLGREGVLWRS